MSIRVVLDRVGAVYAAGEHVTGVVVIDGENGVSHRGLELNVLGVIKIEPTERSGPAFKAAPLSMLTDKVLELNQKLMEAGKLPAGETAIPFSFPLVPTSPTHRRLPETYHGVYIKVEYSVAASIQYMFSRKESDPETMLVYSPGQSEPNAAELMGDQGASFNLSSSSVRLSRKVSAGVLPVFDLMGQCERYYNDIDIPLSGSIRIMECNTPITSVEIQLIRSESIFVAQDSMTGKENTEVQNIQVGDGDVPRNVIIPLHMMFPKWYTCAALITDTVKVEFEINLVVTLEGHTQITQNLPIRLYRAKSTEGLP